MDEYASFRYIYEEEEKIREILGAEGLLDAIEKALGTYRLEDTLAYIARCHDIKTTLKERS